MRGVSLPKISIQSATPDFGKSEKEKKKWQKEKGKGVYRICLDARNKREKKRREERETSASSMRGNATL
jgi:hypothetical protein